MELHVRTYNGGGQHAHSHRQILFPLCGSMAVDIEGVRGIVSSHRLAVIPERHVHHFIPSADCRLLVMDVEADALAPSPSASGGSRPSVTPLEPWLASLFRVLGEEVASNPRGRDVAHVAHAALSLVRPLRTTGARTAAQRVSQVAATAAGESSVAALARGAGLGRSQFHVVFRATLGQSPKQLQLKRLLDRSLDRLSKTAVPVSEIALELGYQNVSSFNRLFRKRFGMTPTEFRSLSNDAAGTMAYHAGALAHAGVIRRR